MKLEACLVDSEEAKALNSGETPDLLNCVPFRYSNAEVPSEAEAMIRYPVDLDDPLAHVPFLPHLRRRPSEALGGN